MIVGASGSALRFGSRTNEPQRHRGHRVMNTEGSVVGEGGCRDSEGWREKVGTERLWRKVGGGVPLSLGAAVERA